MNSSFDKPAARKSTHRRIMPLRNASMFFRVLAFFLFICVFLIVLYSCFCTYSLYNAVGSQLSSSTINLMSLTDTTANVLLDNVRAAVQAASGNATVISSIVAPDIKNNQRNYDLVDYLRNQVSTSRLIKRTILFTSFDQSVFTSDGAISSLAYSMEKEIITEHLHRAEMLRKESGRLDGTVLLQNYGGSVYCCRDFPLEGKYRNGTLLYEIDGSELYEELNRQTEYDIFIYDRDGNSLFSQGEAPGWISTDELERMRCGGSGVLKKPSFHQDSLIYYYLAPGGWLYVYPVPVRIMDEILSNALKLVLPMLLISLVLAAILSSSLSQAIYHPVRRLIDLVGRGETRKADFSNTVNELEFLGMAYTDAVRSNELLQGVVARSSDVLMGKILRHLMRGWDVEEHDIEESLQVMDIPFTKNGNWIVLVFGIVQKMTEENITLLQTDIYRSSLETLTEKISAGRCGHLAVSMEAGRVAIPLCFAPDVDMQQVSEIITALADTTCAQTEQLPCTFSCGVGRLYHNIRDIKFSYSEAVEKLNYQNYTHRQMTPKETGNTISIESTFEHRSKQLARELFALNPEGPELIKRVLDELEHEKGTDLSPDLHMLLQEIYHYIKETEPEGMDTAEEAARKLNACSSPEEMRIWAEDLCNAAYRYFGVCNSRKKYRAVIRAKEYIDEHYTDPNLSLNEVSHSLNITTAYLSRLFHEYQQHSFIEYLNEVRVRRAIFYLTSTTCSVSEIGFKCGFSSAQNFSRVFKKYTELSPSQYREMNSSK